MGKGQSLIGKYLAIARRFIGKERGDLSHRVAGARALARFARLYLTRQRVSPAELATEYDLSAPTYQKWNTLMGDLNGAIVRPELIATSAPVTVLDFACGAGALARTWLDGWAKHDRRPLVITGVDLSPRMLDHAQERCPDPRVTLVRAEGLEFLRHTPVRQYDAILCGWALAYFSHEKLARHFYRILKPGGTLAIIANAKHDISDLENLLVDLLCQHRKEVRRIVELGFNLPDGAAGLTRWFARNGLESVAAGEGEREARFATAEELFCWLQETGAIAGILPMYTNPDSMKALIIAALARKMKSNGNYLAHHRYAWGVWRKGSVT